MANYYGFTRTNYFAVSNLARFREIMGRVQGAEDTVKVFERDVNGTKKYGFGCFSTIYGYEQLDGEGEADYDAFAVDLQEVLAPGDAIVITEIGYEKLRYLYAASQIITKEVIESVDHYSKVGERLCELMGDDGFRTISND